MMRPCEADIVWEKTRLMSAVLNRLIGLKNTLFSHYARPRSKLALILLTLLLALAETALEKTSSLQDSPPLLLGLNFSVLLLFWVLVVRPMTHPLRLKNKSLSERIEQAHTEFNMERQKRQILEARMLPFQKTEVMVHLLMGSMETISPVLDKIINSLEKLYLRSDLSKDLAQHLFELRSSAQHIQQHIQDMKRFTDKSDEHVEGLNLNDCLESTLKVAWKVFKLEHRIHEDLSPLPMMHCSPEQLNLVFLNLLLYADESMCEAGEIKLTTAVVENQILVQIQYTGSGIPLEERAHLFDPFYPVKLGKNGSGLGLSTAYDMIKNLQGAIHVENPPGGGTLFTIYWPIQPVC